MYKIRKGIIKNKRGQYELLVFVILAVVLAVFFLVMSFIIPQIKQTLLNSDLNTSSQAVAALNYTDTIVGGFNYIYLIIFIGLLIGILISSAMISTNKIFIPFYIILFIITIVIGAVMNNVYNSFKTDSNFVASGAALTFADYLIGHYVIVIIVVGILSFILMFGKPSGGGRV
jgi:hypothetical protein